MAKSRIPKLIGLNTYEITSMGTKSNPRTKEVPAGKNKEKNYNPCIRTQIIFIPKKIAIAKAKVTIKWLVKVKL